MENVGKSSGVVMDSPNVVNSAPGVDKTNKKSNNNSVLIGIIVTLILAAVIIAVAIIVVVNNRTNSGGQDTSQTEEEEKEKEEEGVLSDEEATAIHDKESNELMLKLASEEGSSIEDIVAGFKGKMDAATDKKVKAMFAIDYYMYLSLLDQSNERKDEILNALIEADEIVQNLESAATIITLAQTYGEQDLVDKYTNILQERAARADAMDANTEGGNYENTNSNDAEEEEEGGVGVYSATETA